jgi:hypothetical protein
MDDCDSRPRGRGVGGEGVDESRDDGQRERGEHGERHRTDGKCPHVAVPEALLVHVHRRGSFEMLGRGI